jgi:hypothetical protein
MELMNVEGPKNSIKAVGENLGEDGPLRCENDNFKPDLKQHSTIWTSTTRPNNSHVTYENCTSYSRGNVREQSDLDAMMPPVPL